MTDKTFHYEPAVFPLAGVEINPPMLVRALKTKGAMKAGQTYLAKYVWPDGKVMVWLNAEQALGVNPVPMQDLVQMIRVETPANDNKK